ncbi:hypothetical protein GCM10011511_29740 [Puia dinghuensis]|uniref:Uncharacterized protein n=1 Tax=Puia dinghuensis TaxID=1792502 RepID=A0A8J2UDY9_9BACT|nr:hypothetical protein GCM10011511_29740 [Puia dinghuensis]
MSKGPIYSFYGWEAAKLSESYARRRSANGSMGMTGGGRGSVNGSIRDDRQGENQQV